MYSGNLSSRYFRTTAALLLSSTLLLGCALMFFASQYFRNDREKALAAGITTMSDLLTEGVVQAGYIDRTETTKAMGLIAQATDAVLFLTDSQGRTLLCSEGAACVHTSHILPSQLVTDALTTGVVTDAGTLGGIYNERFYTVGMPVLSADGDLLGFLFASSSTASLSVFLSDLFSMFLISTGLMLFVSSILSVWLSQRLAQPLQVMAEAAHSFGRGDFSVRVPVEYEGEVAQLALTFNNMAQDLEQNEESRSAFIDNIAHELRTPMTTIKGFVDGILDGTIPPEQEKRYLQIVSQEVGRLARLTRSMLEISRLEQGTAVQNRKSYDVWQTIVSVVLSAEQRIDEKDIRIEGLVPKKTLVFADPDIVHQVVYNLLDNAIKFTPSQGIISLSVEEKQGRVYVSMHNTGAGIAKEDVPHIFDRFYKGDKSRSLHTGGTGLGLYICKKLLNQGGGDILVRSKQGEFTQFIFTLPAAPKEKEPKQKEPRQKEPKKRAAQTQEVKDDGTR